MERKEKAPNKILFKWLGSFEKVCVLLGTCMLLVAEQDSAKQILDKIHPQNE